jgi:polar amino acid transport system substrate-binding protein
MFRKILIAASLIILGLAGPAGAQVGEPVLLVANKNVPPKSWLDGETARGFAVDASREILTKAGFKVTVEMLPFQRALELTKNGQSILTGTFYTEERTSFLYFSDPMFIDNVLLVVKKGQEFPFSGAKDLAGKRIGHQDGTIYGPLFTAALGTFTADTDNDPAARLKKLMSGRLDAVIMNPGLGAVKMHAKTAGIDLAQLSVLPVPIDQPTIHMALAKTPENEAKLVRINKAIAELRG